MPPNRRIHKKALKLECEWSPCQESFSRMENFCKHAEGHLTALNMAEEDEEEAEGEEYYTSKSWPHSQLIIILYDLVCLRYGFIISTWVREE